MRIGFTATRWGLATPQLQELLKWLLIRVTRSLIDEAHHGDCVGGDAEFHVLCLALEIPVALHPPDQDRFRAYCRHATRVYDLAPYSVRNRAIVDASDLLLAAPRTMDEVLRSGTWSTVRYARSSHKPVVMFKPDGQILHEEGV